ncbi:MAG: hypothetical protein PHP31_07640 [Lentimicrobiaceae bacterium]|nr:hypothetical protein [Lentimicrobiaceae bacterium]
MVENFNTNEISLQDMLGDMDNPKIEYDRPTFEDVRIPNDELTRLENEQRAEELSKETAQEVGKSFADLATNAVTSVCSFIGQEPTERYKIRADQKKDLEKAYTKVAEHYNLKESNPVVTAIILTIIVFAVPIKTALTDRKLKKIEAEQKRQADELAQIQQRQAELEKQMKEKEKETANEINTETNGN